MSIKGVFFDAAGVLYRRPEPTERFVSRLLSAKGLPADLSAEGRARRELLLSQATAGRLTPDQYWDEVLLSYGLVDPEERRALGARIDAYADIVIPFPGAREALAGLKRRGFLLSIVTDTVYPLERKMRWLGQIGVAELVDVVACSTAVGLQKPDSAMYLYAVQQAHLTPAESAFVGHDAGEIEGARRAGLATVAVNYGPGAQADYYADSLLGLLDVPILATAGA